MNERARRLVRARPNRFDQPSTLYLLNRACICAHASSQKTRPSAQYAANDLASPDIEIGSRHPVNCILPRNSREICEAVHKVEKIAARFWGQRGKDSGLCKSQPEPFSPVWPACGGRF